MGNVQTLFDHADFPTILPFLQSLRSIRISFPSTLAFITRMNYTWLGPGFRKPHLLRSIFIYSGPRLQSNPQINKSPVALRIQTEHAVQGVIMLRQQWLRRNDGLSATMVSGASIEGVVLTKFHRRSYHGLVVATAFLRSYHEIR